MFETLTLEFTGQLATLTLNRPARMNALSKRLVDETIAAKVGLKVIQGIWLSSNRIKNLAQIAVAIELTKEHPGVIAALVVGVFRPPGRSSEVASARRHAASPTACDRETSGSSMSPRIACRATLALKVGEVSTGSFHGDCSFRRLG